MNPLKLAGITFAALILMGLGIAWKWNSLPVSPSVSSPPVSTHPAIETVSETADRSHVPTKLRVHWLMSQTDLMIGEVQNISNQPITGLYVRAFCPPNDPIFSQAFPNGKLRPVPVTTSPGYNPTIQPGQWAKFVVMGTEYCSFQFYTLSRDASGSHLAEEFDYSEDNQTHQPVYVQQYQ